MHLVYMILSNSISRLAISSNSVSRLVFCRASSTLAIAKTATAVSPLHFYRRLKVH